MSDVFFPIGVIGRMAITRHDRVVKDAFEDGDTQARAQWPAQYFKRRIELDLSNLTQEEWRYLRTFNSQRSGRYDSFWIRDNLNRGGNAKVRFATALPEGINVPTHRSLRVLLEETAPIRAQPELLEVIAAAGASPVFWFDANRDLYYAHKGTNYYATNLKLWDASGTDTSAGVHLITLNGNITLGNLLGQYQYFDLNGYENDDTQAGNYGSKPAFSAFCIARGGTSATDQSVFSYGSNNTSGGGVGFQLDASNNWSPLTGSPDATWTNCLVSNSTHTTWRSFALTCASGSNDHKLYSNGALIGTDAVTRGTMLKRLVIGGDSNLGNAASDLQVNHILAFNAELTLAQVKALHNLLGYQYGLSAVS